MTHLQRIKNEYQEPFRDTIKAYAIQGHSRRGVAKILEVSHSTIQRYLKQYNCGHYFKPYKDMRPECKNQYGRKGRNGNTAEPIHRAA
jgi:transposase